MNPVALVAGAVAVVGTGSTAAVLRRARRPIHPELDAAAPLPDARELLAALGERAEAAVMGLRPVRWAAPLTLALLVAWVVGSALPVVLVAASAVVALVGRRVVARRIERTFRRGVVPALEGTVAALHGGLGLREAFVAGCIAAGGVVGLDGRLIRRRLERGETFVESLEWWARRRSDADVTLVVTVLVLAHQLGGPVVTSLETVTEVVRARRTLEDEIAAQAAQAVASAVLLAALPVFSLAVLALSDPAIPGWLLGTPGGVACLVAGTVLEAVGIAWMLSVVGGVR